MILFLKVLVDLFFYVLTFGIRVFSRSSHTSKADNSDDVYPQLQSMRFIFIINVSLNMISS